MDDPGREPPNSADGELLLQCLRGSAAEGKNRLERLCVEHPERAARLRAMYASLDEFGLVDEPVSAPAGARFGSYRLVTQIGSGGMGVVHLALQEPFDRRVALKVVHAGHAAPPRARERFQREIQAISKLDHPHICAVHDAGEVDGVPYLALRYIEGETLQQRIARERDVAPTAAATRRRRDWVVAIGEKLASALQAAHERGIVHRDVKPGNVMIEAGTEEPQLLDFGLARLADTAEATLTLAGDRLGTPAYMSPEQVAGGVVDARTDVYSLGAVMFEALTLRPLHEGPTREALYRQILGGEVSRLGRHDRQLGGDLEVVIATALEPDPTRRYATAAAFAADLRRVRLHQAILAQRAGVGRRLQRFVRRSPALAAMLAVLFLAVVGSSILLSIAAHNLRIAEANEGALRARAVAATVPREGLADAVRAVERNESLQTASALHATFVEDHEAAVLSGHTGSLFGALWSPAGDRILTWSADSWARLWRSDGTELERVPLGNDASMADFASDGRFVVGSDDGTARICDRDGKQIGLLPHGPGDRPGDSPALPFFDPTRSHAVRVVRFSPDGRRIATVSTDRHVRIWDAATSKVVGELVHEGPVVLAAWSPDGAVLASAEGYADYLPDRERFRLLVWHLGPDGLPRTVGALESAASFRSIAFSPDGATILAACNDGIVHVWSWREGPAARRELRHGDKVLHALFSPRGDRVLTCQADGEVRLYATDSWGPPHRALHQGQVRSACFLDGGDRVATASEDNTVRIFDAELRPQLVLRGHRERVVSVMPSPDGRQLLSASWDRTARVWNLVDPLLPRLFGHGRSVRVLAKAADGGIVSVGDDRTLRIWDRGTGRARIVPVAASAATIDFAIDANGREQVLLGHDDAIARRYALATGELLARYPDPQGRHVSALFAGERVLLSGFGVQRHSWALDGSQGRPWGMAGLNAYALARANATGLVAIGDWGGRVTLCDDAGGSQQVLDTGTHWVNVVAFAPDGAHLAAAGNDARVRIWPVVGRRVVDATAPLLVEVGGAVLALAWSPNGSLLAAAGSDGSVHLLDAKTGRPLLILRGHAGASVRALVFASDARLLSGGDDGAIQVWSTSTAEVLEHARRRLQRR